MGEGLAPCTFFDGASNQRHQVDVDIQQNLIISENGRIIATWAFGSIRRADGPLGFLRLSCVDAPSLARLEIADPALAALITARCAAIDADGGGGRQTMRVVGWSMAAIVSILLSVVFVVPYVAEKATPYIPPSFDRWLGRVAEPQLALLFGGKECAESEGSAVVRALVRRIGEAGGVEGEVTAKIMNVPVANAFALPGGRIFIFDGLIRQARNVDELAGVIAHELGHVRHRDQVRAMIHHGGATFLIGLLFGDIAGGGAIIVATRTLFHSAYSREAESAADEFARTTMLTLGRSPLPLGEFLVRLSGGDKASGLAIFDSHPLGEERRERLARAGEPVLGPPLLDKVEWEAVRAACHKLPPG